MGKEKSANFLTLEEELECGEIIAKSRENPDDKALREKADEAINKLFIANEKGIYSIVHSFYKWQNCISYYPQEEAIADAILAFIRFCREKYDPTKGFKVMTGATWHIRKMLQTESNSSRAIPMRHSGWKYNEVCRLLREYKDKDLSCDVMEYLKEGLPKVNPSEIITILNIREGVMSFDYEITDDTGSTILLSETIKDNSLEDGYDLADKQEEIDRLFSLLNKDEITVMKNKWDLSDNPFSKEQFLKEYNISEKEYRRLASSGMRKIRKRLRETGELHS